jgi:PKD domain
VRIAKALAVTVALIAVALTSLVAVDVRVVAADIGQPCDIDGDGEDDGVIIGGECSERGGSGGSDGPPADGTFTVSTAVPPCNEPPGPFDIDADGQPDDDLVVDGWDCALDLCGDQEGVSRWIWEREETYAGGERVDEGLWRHVDRTCVPPPGPSVEAIREQVRQLLPKPEPGIAPPGGTTLTNLVTYFHAVGPKRDTVTFEVVGQQVTLEYWPVSYTWSFGDGSDPYTTALQGAPWPNTDVSHTYDQRDTFTVDVDVRYAAQYRVGGGEWQPLPGGVQIDNGPTVELEVLDAASRLVS